MSSTSPIFHTPTDTHSSSSSSPNMASADYLFGFFITFVVLLLIFFGCGIAARRRASTPDRDWDTAPHLADPQDTLFQGASRRGRRRILVPPLFWEAWLTPPKLTETAAWQTIQPVSVSIIPTNRSQVPCKHLPAIDLFDPPPHPRQRFTFPFPRSFNILSSRSRSRHPHGSAAPHMYTQKQEQVDIENSLDVFEIAVVICMPSPIFPYRDNREGPSCQPTRPGHVLQEFQIGVAQVPWTSAETGTQC